MVRSTDGAASGSPGQEGGTGVLGLFAGSGAPGGAARGARASGSHTQAGETPAHPNYRFTVQVSISVEILAESPIGFDEGVQRAVKENCNVLKFKNAEFE